MMISNNTLIGISYYIDIFIIFTTEKEEGESVAVNSTRRRPAVVTDSYPVADWSDSRIFVEYSDRNLYDGSTH